MENALFLETYTPKEEFLRTSSIKVPFESFVTYIIYEYCNSATINLNFVTVPETTIKTTLDFCPTLINVKFPTQNEIPWQVTSCLYPVIIFKHTIITGLCAVARHICNYGSSPPIPQEHEEGLLGFRKSCLQAPNEVSIWTKFCEVDIVKTINEVHNTKELLEIPQNLVRFENHLNKPVRVHNVYKIARDLKKIDNVTSNNVTKPNESLEQNKNKVRTSKTRKWKSNVTKILEVDSSIKIEDLDVDHQFAEGPFLTLADIILFPSYYILIKMFGKMTFEKLMPLTYKWYVNILREIELKSLTNILNSLDIKEIAISPNVIIPTTEDVSLYKCDPKRHNPKKRMFTKEEDIVNALSNLVDGMELNVTHNKFETGINWDDIPDGANPTAGHLPGERILRKSQQLENLALAVLEIAQEGDLIVDFCSGSGHLGILIAYLLPKCTVILLENKEQSLLRARMRVHDMGLKNVYFFQCNLDFYIGKFDIGIALHACGVASDLVLDKCLKANAKFVLCPCCYGSLHVTDRLVYPRSGKFSDMPIDHYMCLGHAADQTHEEHPLSIRGARCMAAIDSDRGHLAKEFGYKVSLSRLKPLSCTPKNNLLIGVPT